MVTYLTGVADQNAGARLTGKNPPPKRGGGERQFNRERVCIVLHSTTTQDDLLWRLDPPWFSGK